MGSHSPPNTRKLDCADPDRIDHSSSGDDLLRDRGRARLDDAITRLAGRQRGLVTRSQLMKLRLTARGIQSRVEGGRLRRVHRGVYLLGNLRGRLRPDSALEMAAVLASGPGTVVSHRHAATQWQLGPRTGPPIHVLTPGRTPSRRPGIVAHRADDLTPDDVATVDGLPVTSPLRTLLDLATVAGRGALERAVARAERSGLVDPASLRAAVEARSGRPGTPMLRSILGTGTGAAFTRSEAESRFLDLVRRSGLEEPEANVVVTGREVDFFWRAEGLVVEVDGFASHGSRRGFAADRRRDAALLAAGLRVMRVTWEQITQEPFPTIASLAGALAREPGSG